MKSVFPTWVGGFGGLFYGRQRSQTAVWATPFGGHLIVRTLFHTKQGGYEELEVCNQRPGLESQFRCLYSHGRVTSAQVAVANCAILDKFLLLAVPQYPVLENGSIHRSSLTGEDRMVTRGKALRTEPAQKTAASDGSEKASWRRPSRERWRGGRKKQRLGQKEGKNKPALLPFPLKMLGHTGFCGICS